MRIKRFVAPDMRTALRMVRDEQGPDAVILSNRPIPEGIEVVAATDYDEALVQQALRSAAPGFDAPAPAAPAKHLAARPTPARRESAAPIAVRGESSSRAEAMIAALSGTPARTPLADRARTVVGIDSRASLEEAVAASRHAPKPAGANGSTGATQIAPTYPGAPGRVDAAGQASARASLLDPGTGQDRAPDTSGAAAPDATMTTAPGDEFRALLARLTAAEEADGADVEVPSPALQAAGTLTPSAAVIPAPVATTLESAPAANSEPASAATVASAQPSEPAGSSRSVSIETAASGPAAAPALQAVAAAIEDPAFMSMRAELSAMRELMERQMDQLAIERLRGSVGRAHAFDTLVAYGCDEGVAQSVASRIDARLAPDETRGPMFDEFARMIMVNRVEPIDDGGVIALVGPTGAGKTTTIAKLAARFAARHRARDVALVTTDTERAGAREQLHALGRRLGITVCEAEGPQALNATLDQLADYPLVLVDTAGYAVRDRALLSQILWLRTARRVRSLLVLPANANPHDLGEIIRRYRPASPEGVVLTKTDETGRLGAALSVLVRQDLSLAYTTSGQQVPGDIEAADPARLVAALEKLRRAADNPLMTEDRHAVA